MDAQGFTTESEVQESGTVAGRLDADGGFSGYLSLDQCLEVLDILRPFKDMFVKGRGEMLILLDVVIAMIKDSPQNVFKIIRLTEPKYTSKDPNEVVGKVMEVFKQIQVFELVSLGTTAEIF